ncbi:TonB-dependent receptor domain-containing protein [Tenacibaculum finnmarkense]|uniref:TonB-dependent receptor domain-containing protein n=1 Tax=Tenacibaculum finnmarkense TaxID=2781243 RepID=UPI00187B9F1D|nr:TonB-dependent receptor [Tenacibaculum finnmarkense]MBE7691361.1 TonB-dependent receptor [Tenacibaculum finnmarkense genomovar finnmarkense]
MNKFFLFLFTVFSVSLFAQKQHSKPLKIGIVSGKVIDEVSKEALPYVNIIIKNTSDKILTGGITNDDGTFSITNISEGKHRLEIQFIGYKTVSKVIIISSKTKKIALGTVYLSEDNTALDEIVVRAETSTVTQKIDRKVINVGKDLASAGATASELLNNVQSVSVDSQSGALSLRGNSNVRVLVDGKPTNMSTAQLLQQIPATSIKSIELITNPSAKYNPEGMSGIINIILNKGANIGFNGAINTGITQGENTRYNASLNMNYKTGKVNFYTNLGYNGGKGHNYGTVVRTGKQASTQNFIFDNDRESYLVKLGADIYINDKNTLSFYTTQNSTNAFNNGSVKVYDFANTLGKNAPNISDNNNNSASYNMNYKIDFSQEGHNLEFEATYSDSENDEDATNNETIILATDPEYKFLNYFNTIKNKANNTLINLDYTKPISKNGKLELGLEYRTNQTKNNNNTDQDGYKIATNGTLVLDVNDAPIIEAIGKSAFTYNRDIFSGYINYGHQFNKLSMQLGARIEQYDVKGSFTNKNETKPYTDAIFSVYPSAFFTFNPSEKNQYQLSYSRRVDRPSISQVNPIREWSTPLITSVGNPNLKPQFTNSFELNYTRKIKGGSLTFGTFYRKVTDEISTILYKDPSDNTNTKQLKSDQNFDGNNRYGFEMSSNYRITKWWSTNASLDLYSQTLKGLVSNVEKQVENTAFNARLSNSFSASKKLKFQLFAMYRGANKNLQFNIDPMWMINTGARYSILKGKGSLSFKVNDIFKGMKFRFNATDPYTQTGQFNWESRTAYLGFNYRFGGGKNKAKRRRRRDNNEKQGGGFM